MNFLNLKFVFIALGAMSLIILILIFLFVDPNLLKQKEMILALGSLLFAAFTAFSMASER